MNDLEAALYVLPPEAIQTLALLHQRPDLSRCVLPLIGLGSRYALLAYNAMYKVLDERSPLGREYECLDLTEFGREVAAEAAKRYPDARIVLTDDALALFREALENRGLQPEGR
jgi:hypothetical protein